MNVRLPAVTGSQVIRALEQAGFILVRIKGSHHVLEHRDDTGRVVTVPVHGSKALRKGTLKSILQQSKLTVDQLRSFL